MEDEHIFTKFLSSLKRKWLLMLLGVLGIALVLAGGSMSSQSKTDTANTYIDSIDVYKETLERNLTAMLSEMQGVGEVVVVVTLEEGDTYTYAGSKPTSHQMPRVRGVAVVCEGGDSPTVKANIISMLSALLDIGTHHIYVGPKSA